METTFLQGWSTIPLVLAAGIVLGQCCDQVVCRLADHSRSGLSVAITATVLLAVIWSLAATPDRQVMSCVLGCALIALAAIDLLTMQLPDLLTLPLLACGFLLSLKIGEPGLLDRAAGAFLGYGSLAVLGFIYRSMRGRDGLGLGDAKLVGAAGAWLGWAALPSVLLLGSSFGLLWALVRRRSDPGSAPRPLPFGPALAAAFWLVWLYGPIRF